LKSTETILSSGAKSYEGEFRLSAEDTVRSVTVLTYPTHTYPDARLVHSKLVTLGETQHLCQVYALEVERGLLYAATPPRTMTLGEHTSKFQTCPMSVQDFARGMIEGLDQLHGMGIAHGNVGPETILLNESKLVISDFSRTSWLEGAMLTAIADDVKAAASTILFALSGGATTFEDIVDSAQTDFHDDTVFDGIKTFKPEVMDLLRMLVSPQVSLKSELLARPFFWSNTKIVEFLGEEVGSLLDPSATEQSNKAQHDFIVALERKASTELGGEYDELMRQDGPSWSALMEMMNPDYPLGGVRL
jgi:serine/threonine protein kinase